MSSARPGVAFDPSRELAGRLERAIVGPMWHGPAVDQLLLRFTARTALLRPIDGAHCAWELTLHLSAWAGFAIARVTGKGTLELDDAQDWPPVPRVGTESAWREVTDELRSAYARLAELVRALPAESLLQPIKNRDYDMGTMLNGIVEHAAYHGGQLALLAKALDG